MGPRPDQMFVFARGGRAGVPPPPPPPPPPAFAEATAGKPASTDGLKRVLENKVVVSMVEREDRITGGRIVTRAGQLGLEGKWMLMAKHRAGSLEAAVAAVRARNLMIAPGVLMLLTMAVGLIVVSARRAKRWRGSRWNSSPRCRTSCARRSR